MLTKAKQLVTIDDKCSYGKVSQLGEKRNAERTRNSILQAAKEELLEKGYSGTRIESIAARAGVKKQLIYHYFNGKEELIRETIMNLLSATPPENFHLPTNPVNIAEFRLKVNLDYLMEFLKFTTWEALDTFPGGINEEENRTKILQSYTDDMKAKQEAGLVPRDLNPALITLMLSSLTIYPLINGHVTRMITGLSPDDPEFQQEWSRFLRRISEKIFAVESK